MLTSPSLSTALINVLMIISGGGIKDYGQYGWVGIDEIGCGDDLILINSGVWWCGMGCGGLKLLLILIQHD